MRALHREANTQHGAALRAAQSNECSIRK